MKETERQIMIGQGAVMFAVLFLVAWLGGLHWILAILVALLLTAPVLIAIEGIRYFFESRAEGEAEGEDEAEGEEEGAQQREAAE